MRQLHNEIIDSPDYGGLLGARHADMTIGVHKDVITKFYESKLVAGFQDSKE